MTTTSNSSEYFRIGTLSSAHGLDGRIKVLIITDIESRFQSVKKVFLNLNGFYRQETITDFEPYKGRYALIRLKSVSSREDADRLAGVDVYIDRSEAERTSTKLDADTFYYYDIIGCDVYHNEEYFGIVEDIFQAGAGEILVINSNKKEYLIPFVESMVDVSEIKSKKVKITPVEGLLEEQS